MTPMLACALLLFLACLCGSTGGQRRRRRLAPEEVVSRAAEMFDREDAQAHLVASEWPFSAALLGRATWKTRDGLSETQHLLRLAGIEPHRSEKSDSKNAPGDGAVWRPRRRTAATEQYYDDGEPKAAKALTSEHKHVLDFGYGSGHMTRLLRRSLQGLEQVHGIEVSRAQVARAHSASGFDDIVLTSHLGFGKLPYRDGFFSTIVSQQAFSFCPDRVKTFSEMFRILVPGGVIAFQDVFLSRAKGVMLHAAPVEDAFGLVLGTIKEYKTDLKKAGFVDIKLYSIHDIAEHIDLQQIMTEKSASGQFKPSNPQEQHPGLDIADLDQDGNAFKYGDLAVSNALAHNALALSIVVARKPLKS